MIDEPYRTYEEKYKHISNGFDVWGISQEIFHWRGTDMGWAITEDYIPGDFGWVTCNSEIHGGS